MKNATEQTLAPEPEATLLTKQQMWGSNALEVMKSYGTITGMSDLAVLLGGNQSNGNFTSEGQRSSAIWLASSDANGNACSSSGSFITPYVRTLGSRPALPPSVASSIGLREAKRSREISGVDVVEYGEYPQTIAEETVARKLEGLSEAQLNQIKTGKTYTFDNEKTYAYDKPFNAKSHAEYQYNGKKYIRVEAHPDYNGYPKLSDGNKPVEGKIYWVEVQPIEWLRDPSGICVARQALFAGIHFDRKIKYYGKFEDTDIYHYLNAYFVKQIQPSNGLAQEAGEGQQAQPSAAEPIATVETEVAAKTQKLTGRAQRFAEIHATREASQRAAALTAEAKAARRPSDGWGKAL